MQALLDTGPWVALIDKSETMHKKCFKWLQDFSGELYTTEAVLTEVIWLLNFSTAAQLSALDFVIKGAVNLVPSTKYSLIRVQKLMDKYSDLPMDFADATLVTLAEETQLLNICTLDKKDFILYRLSKNRSFVIHP
jgi:predicted nucleic acid-binding protein